MIQVIVYYSVQPIFEMEFTALFARVREVVLQEEGCIHYELFVSPYNPSRFCLVEKWASQAAIDAHLATQNLADFRRQSSVFFAEKAVVEVKEIVNEQIR